MIDETPVQAAVRQQLGLRIGPEMAGYLQRSAEAVAIGGGGGPLALIGGDARTGVPMRKRVPLEVVRQVLDGAREAKAGG